jgi:hypothetical protein
MPLLDHFHPPLAPRRHWESFHAAWAGSIADLLNRQLLPDNYFAEEQTHAGTRIEIDVATFESQQNGIPVPETSTATLAAPQVWAPPVPAFVMPGVRPDRFEVLMFQDEGGARLVAAVELVSPGNKDRSEQRRAFAIKCASYLYQGVGLVVIDIVTSRLANLHNEIVRLTEGQASFLLPETTSLYAVAYRPWRHGGRDDIDVWPATLALGEALPTLPLALECSLCVPLDLEATYMDACRRRRLVSDAAMPE